MGRRAASSGLTSVNAVTGLAGAIARPPLSPRFAAQARATIPRSPRARDAPSGCSTPRSSDTAPSTAACRRRTRCTETRSWPWPRYASPSPCADRRIIGSPTDAPQKKKRDRSSLTAELGARAAGAGFDLAEEAAVHPLGERRGDVDRGVGPDQDADEEREADVADDRRCPR